MFDIFNKENYYWCDYCEKYSMDLIALDERDDIVIKTYECICCYEQDVEVEYLD